MNPPKFEGIDAVYKSKADNKDIRDLLVKLVPKATAQMKDFSKQFKGRTEEETCRNIFNYIKSNIRYVADGSEQIIKLPSALLRKRVGDCKSFSLFTASVLENLKIPYKFVYTSYNSNPIPQHVYVVTNNGCIIDVVYGIFNQEKKPTYKYIQDMNVRYMAGIGCTDCGGTCSSGMGATVAGAALKKVGTAIKTGVQTAGASVASSVKTAPTALAKGGLVGGRALVLAMIKNNSDGFASKMAKIPDATLKKYWEKVGGNFQTLQSTIKTGASKPAKKLGFLARVKALLAKKGIKGIGAANADTEIQSAIVAVSTAIGTAIAPAAGTAAGASIGAVLAGIYPIVAEMVRQTPATETQDIVNQDVTADAEALAKGETTSSFDFNAALPYIAIGGAALYFLLKKK